MQIASAPENTIEVLTRRQERQKQNFQMRSFHIQLNRVETSRSPEMQQRIVKTKFELKKFAGSLLLTSMFIGYKKTSVYALLTMLFGYLLKNVRSVQDLEKRFVQLLHLLKRFWAPQTLPLPQPRSKQPTETQAVLVQH